MSPPPDKPPDSHIPPFDFTLFLQNQAQELALRREEIELKREQAHSSWEYANKALEAQLEDRTRERAFTLKGQQGARIFVGSMVGILAVFLSIALFLDKDQIAMEIVKSIGLLFAGGIGGY